MTSMRPRGAPFAAWWRTAAWLVSGLAVAASAWGALIVAQGPGRTTTYAGSSDLATWLTIAAGVALGIAGMAVAMAGSPRVGGPAALAGILWFAPVWVGWQQGPLLVRSIAMLAAGFVVPLLVHVVIAYPNGRTHTLWARAIVVAAYAEAVLVAVLSAVLRDPFDDPFAWANDTGNVFVVQSLPDLARVVVVADQWFSLALAVSVIALCAWRVAVGSPPARRVQLPVALPAAAFMVAVASRAALLLGSPLEDPVDARFRSAYLLAAAACVALAAALVWGVVRTRLQHRAVARIASNLGEAPAPGSLETALGRAVDDPALRIAYWLPADRRYVDASGRALSEPVAEPGRALTRLVRGDQPVAVVTHGRGLPDIETAMGAAFTLALDNERLQAEGLARLEELRASRARIVETGDRERRLLERDLHDGAQQRLLAASYEIRVTASSAAAERDAGTAATLDGALTETLTALDELRGLAQGLFPAILGEAGLAVALASLADTAPVVVDTSQVSSARYPAAAELGAYLLVVEAVEDAAGRLASRIAVSAGRDEDVLLVTVEDDGSEPLADLVRSGDRIGALGGTLEVCASTRRAEIPCA